MNVKLKMFILGLYLFVGYGCKNNCVSFSGDHSVAFYTTHPSVEIVPAEFETITEQYLVKDAHNVGATFETVTEQVLVSQAYTSYKAWDVTPLNIVNDAENNQIGNVDCYFFYSEEDIIMTELPAVYTTRSWQRLVENGMGDIVPAQYETNTWRRTVKDGSLIKPLVVDRSSVIMIFTIPDHLTMQEYLEKQFEQQDITDCIEGNSYQIL